MRAIVIGVARRYPYPRPPQRSRRGASFTKPGAAHLARSDRTSDVWAATVRHDLEHQGAATALEVARAEQLTPIPAAARLACVLLLREGLGALRDVSAEDDGVYPHVANEVRDDIAGERPASAPAAGQRGKQRVVLQKLAARLAQQRDDLPSSPGTGLLAAAHRIELQVIDGDGPLEHHRH